MKSLEQRIADIEAREAIADVINRYTEAVRRGSHPSVLELMLEDCVIELRQTDPDDPDRSEPITRYVGHDEIRGSFVDQAGNQARVWPMVHNLRIAVDGDEARSTCVLASVVWPQGEQNFGEYRDTFRRVDGEWYFASRIYSGFGNAKGQFAREAYAAYQAAKDGPVDS